MTYVYLKTEPCLYTVGFFDPKGKFIPESDHESDDKAASRCHYLNGGELNTSALRMLAVLRRIKEKYEMSRGDFSLTLLEKCDDENIKAMARFIENLDMVTGHVNDAIAKAEDME